MTDINGGAPAPADTGSVPIENIPQAPAAIDSAGPERQEVPIEPEKPSTSISDAIKKAEAKVAEKAAAEKVEKPEIVAKEAKVDPKPRDDTTGKFAAKEPAEKPVDAPKPVDSKPVNDAPARFSDDAKAIWKDTPEPIRRESERAIRELTQGVEKYKTENETYRQERERIAPFHEMAKQAGTTVEAALKSYTDLDKLLHTDKLKGIEAVLEKVGVSPRDYAAHILNQSPDQQASQSDATIRELKQEIASLREQVGGVTQNFQQQREQSTLQEVTKFAQDNTRFEELAEDIAFFMKSGRAKDLAEAYQLAERLNPAPAQAIAEVPAASSAADLLAQTQRGQKSIAGAPPAGSSQPRTTPSTSVRDALKRAMARAS